MRPIPVISLFIHFQCNHGASDSGPRSSDGMDLSLCVNEAISGLQTFAYKLVTI